MEVTNTGNLTLSDVQINDTELPALAWTCTLAPATPWSVGDAIAPAGVVTCTAPYMLTHDDMQADGTFTNVATAEGTPPGEPPIESPPDDASVTFTARFTVVKQTTEFPNLPGFQAPDFPFDWSVQDQPSTDPDFFLSSDESIGSGDLLVPVEGEEFWAEELVDDQQFMPRFWELVTDPQQGDRLKCVNANATDPAAELPLIDDGIDARTTVRLVPGDDVTCTFSNRFNADVGITLEKTASPTTVIQGGTTTYTIELSNSGNVPLRLRNDGQWLASIADDKCTGITFDQAASEAYDRDGDLNTLLMHVPALGGNPELPAETWVFTCVGSDLQPPADQPGGVIVNTASGDVPNPLAADPDDPQNDLTAEDTAEVVVLVPGIALAKTVDKPTVSAGTEVTYTFTVTNTGDTPLRVDKSTGLVDPLCGTPVTYQSGDAGDDGLIAVHTGEGDPEAWVFTCTSIITEDTHNVATVTGTPEFEGQIGTPVSADGEADVDVVAGGIEITKTASATSVNAGDEVTFTYQVVNTGGFEISNLEVTDDKCSPVGYRSGDTDADGILDVDETWVYSCTQVIRDTTTNVATARGTTPDGEVVEDTDTVTVTVKAKQTPSTGAADWLLTATGLAVALIGIGALMVFRRRELGE